MVVKTAFDFSAAIGKLDAVFEGDLSDMSDPEDGVGCNGDVPRRGNPFPEDLGPLFEGELTDISELSDES